MNVQRQLKKKKIALQRTMLAALSFYISLGKRLSINKLTILGFILVALPLAVALLFSANKVSQLADLNTQTIQHVTQLTKLNNQFEDTVIKIERYASQYVVLKDIDLYVAYDREQQTLQRLIEDTQQSQSDKKLISLLDDLSAEKIRLQQIMRHKDTLLLPLEKVQDEFIPLRDLVQAIAVRNNNIANLGVINIQEATESISTNILKHLYIIPITLVVAGVFIRLITKPLQRLTDKIAILEQGKFEQEIRLNGPAEVVGIVDALENMRQRLHSLELQKSSFIRHISHELKTPLAAIREGTELIYDNSVGPLNPEQKEICDIIRNSVNRLQRLIEDLLDFNIVLDSTSLQNLEELNITTSIQQACEARKLDIKSKNITVNYANDACYIFSNAKQIDVVLDNILSNAIKYSPVNGNIEIIHYLDEQHFSLAISDQGPGVAAEQINKVFDAFYQGSPPENSQIKGSGLGLTIVKELLLRLNGSIKISQPLSESANELAGALVTITLPNKQLETEV